MAVEVASSDAERQPVRQPVQRCRLGGARDAVLTLAAVAAVLVAAVVAAVTEVTEAVDVVVVVVPPRLLGAAEPVPS